MEEAKLEAEVIAGATQVAIVQKHFKGVGDPRARVRDESRIERRQAVLCRGGEGLLSGGLGQHFQRNGVSVRIERVLEASVVVGEVNLARGSEKFGSVYGLDVVERHPIAIVHGGIVPEPGKERLDVVRDANTQRFEHGVRDGLVEGKVVGLGEPSQARNAGIPVPRA